MFWVEPMKGTGRIMSNVLAEKGVKVIAECFEIITADVKIMEKEMALGGFVENIGHFGENSGEIVFVEIANLSGESFNFWGWRRCQKGKKTNREAKLSEILRRNIPTSIQPRASSNSILDLGFHRK
jgi:hypothetical protein